MRLGVNIDHVASLRNARGGSYPSVVAAALIAEESGADLITLHLREDRRHIKDEDVYILRQTLNTAMNLEMASTNEMIKIALKVKPNYVCLVPEKREEITTEGGLDLILHKEKIANAVGELQSHGISTTLFIDADEKQIYQAQLLGAHAIEIHTGKYANAINNKHQEEQELLAISNSAQLALSLGLEVHAGHGLNYHNVQKIVKVKQIEELNIGHAIIGHSVLYGLASAVSKMKRLITKGA